MNYKTKTVKCFYNKSDLNNKLKNLAELVNVNTEKKDMAFYPIFISSRYHDKREVDIHLEDLTEASIENGLMIFLFIENDDSKHYEKFQKIGNFFSFLKLQNNVFNIIFETKSYKVKLDYAIFQSKT